jgi:hypothetical protein
MKFRATRVTSTHIRTPNALLLIGGHNTRTHTLTDISRGTLVKTVSRGTCDGALVVWVYFAQARVSITGTKAS